MMDSSFLFGFYFQSTNLFHLRQVMKLDRQYQYLLSPKDGTLDS